MRRSACRARSGASCGASAANSSRLSKYSPAEPFWSWPTARRQRIRLQRVRRRRLPWADPGRECSLVRDTGFVERAPRHAAAYRTRQGHPFGGAIHQPDAGSHYTAIQQRDTDAGRADPVGRDRRDNGLCETTIGLQDRVRAPGTPFAPGQSTPSPTCRTSSRRLWPTRASAGSGAAHPRKPRPSTTLDSTPASTPVTRKEVCTRPGMLQWAPRSAEHGNTSGRLPPDHLAHPSIPTQGNPTLESRPTERYRTTRHSHLQQSTPEPGQRQPATTHDSRAQNRG